MSFRKSLCDLLRSDASKVWSAIMNHPFVIELFRGTLPIEKFKYYVKQDYNYLLGMMRAYSLLAAKADYEVARLALEIAYADATIEMDNYVKLLGKLGLTLNEVLSEEPSPTNEAYMNFLISTCALKTPLECLVATLPCYWTYLEIAKKHKELLKENKVKVYVEWAQTYLSKEYEELVKKLRGLIDNLWLRSNVEYRTLRRIFIKASIYEWMFWESSYKMEVWPISP